MVRDSDAYRVVHGEADLLPALVVDRYGDYLVMQTLDQGMDAAKSEIASCLEEIFQPKGIVARNDAAVRAKEQLPLETDGVSPARFPRSVAVRMNGLHLQADLLHGQKTGIFLDQRENYRAAARYAAAARRSIASPRPAASPCTWPRKCESRGGGRQLRARAGHGARERRGERHRQHRIPRRPTSSICWPGTCLRAAAILDGGARPAGLRQTRESGSTGPRGYKEINLRALRLLGPGGVLVTCSCSHHISEAMLLELVAQAALDADRTLRVLERRTQSQDHPILLTVPETLYLKCLILRWCRWRRPPGLCRAGREACLTLLTCVVAGFGAN